MCFLEGSYKCKKFKFGIFWERPLYEIWEYAFKKGNPVLNHANKEHILPFSIKNILRGYCTPSLKLACFICFLKTVNTFLKNNVCILKQIG